MSTFDWNRRLHANVATVRQNIAAACARAGRLPDQVRLVAVTKSVGPPVIRALVAGGIVDVAENRVQQLAARAAELGLACGGWPEPAAADRPGLPRWHMIGHLQRNKVRTLLPCARIVHSLDSERLASTIGHQAQEVQVVVDVLVEVNVSGEGSKEGVRPEDVAALAAAVARERHLCLRGLMTMAPLCPVAEAARPYFARLRTLLERLRQAGAVPSTCAHLSMGMSQDYAVAVEEGATLVRVGSALFEGLGGPDRPAR